MNKNKISYLKFFIKSLVGKRKNRHMLKDLNYCFAMAYSAEMVLKKISFSNAEIEFLKNLAFKKQAFYKLKDLNFFYNEKIIINLANKGLILLKCKFKRRIALSDAGRFFLVQIAEIVFKNKN